MVFTICLTCIAIGSEVAYGIFVSLNVSGLVTSYIICIACTSPLTLRLLSLVNRLFSGILRKRLLKEPFPPSPFNLGRAGNAINIIALCFLVIVWVFQFFPFAPNPGVKDMNWSCVIWATVLVFFMIYYTVWGRRNYLGPIVHVKHDLYESVRCN